jgi:hypothetical protein
MTGDGALIHAIANHGKLGEKTTLMNLIGLLDQPTSRPALATRSACLRAPNSLHSGTLLSQFEPSNRQMRCTVQPRALPLTASYRYRRARAWHVALIPFEVPIFFNPHSFAAKRLSTRKMRNLVRTDQK